MLYEVITLCAATHIALFRTYDLELLVRSLHSAACGIAPPGALGWARPDARTAGGPWIARQRSRATQATYAARLRKPKSDSVRRNAPAGVAGGILCLLAERNNFV